MTFTRSIVAAGMLAILSASGAAYADKSEKMLEQLKEAVAQYPEIKYSMMGDIVYLHGTSDNIPELNNIIGALMKIKGISEVRSNIFM